MGIIDREAKATRELLRENTQENINKKYSMKLSSQKITISLQPHENINCLILIDSNSHVFAN